MPDNSSIPEILRGAFIVFYPHMREPRTIVFQLNPEPIKRSILPAQSKKLFSASRGLRERISFSLFVDKNLGDAFFVRDGEDISHGVLPFLSAIELLAYPVNAMENDSGSTRYKRFLGWLNNIAGLFSGKRSNSLPLVGLVLGEERIIPIKIKSLKIVEQAFDTKLSPVRAEIKIVMETLSARESNGHPANPAIKKMYENYHLLKVKLANEMFK